MLILNQTGIDFRKENLKGGVRWVKGKCRWF